MSLIGLDFLSSCTVVFVGLPEILLFCLLASAASIGTVMESFHVRADGDIFFLDM